MTEGFGCKWKDFFYTLETYHDLDVSNPSHVWLAHWLFLPSINLEALAWAEAWNSHKIQLDGERRRSPRQLFIQSNITDGVRGLPPAGTANPATSSEHGDYTSHGIDLGVQEVSNQVAHENHRDGDNANPPHSHPDWINEVVVEPPYCPLTDDQVDELRLELAASVDLESTDMNIRRIVWAIALQLYEKLVA